MGSLQKLKTSYKFAARLNIMKSKLQIRPVHQYRTPRYPAWNDPNPLDHPDALPFPFSQRVLSWILSSGLLASDYLENVV